MSGKRGDDCPITASVADSPDGPWRTASRIIIPNGPPGAWDQFSIHDPYPLMYRDRIYLYYKSDMAGQRTPFAPRGWPSQTIRWGRLPSTVESGAQLGTRDYTVFPFKRGIAALVIRHGLEHNTIQFAPDGVNFEVMATTSLMSAAGGPYGRTLSRTRAMGVASRGASRISRMPALDPAQHPRALRLRSQPGRP